jgi:putative sterol carrier protein
MTPQEIFNEMPKNLNADAAKGMNSVIQFNLSGDNGGQWYTTIKDGKAEVAQGTAPAPNMTLSMSASDYVDMIMGKLNGQMAFMSGKLKISGDMGLAMKMQNLFKRPGA